jgi:hypothetical protein
MSSSWQIEVVQVVSYNADRELYYLFWRDIAPPYIPASKAKDCVHVPLSRSKGRAREPLLVHSDITAYLDTNLRTSPFSCKDLICFQDQNWTTETIRRPSWDWSYLRNGHGGVQTEPWSTVSFHKAKHGRGHRGLVGATSNSVVYGRNTFCCVS